MHQRIRANKLIDTSYVYCQLMLLSSTIATTTNTICNYYTGARCNARPVATGRVICVCDWLRDATGLHFGDLS